jgi:hypothetical protein
MYLSSCQEIGHGGWHRAEVAEERGLGEKKRNPWPLQQPEVTKADFLRNNNVHKHCKTHSANP